MNRASASLDAAMIRRGGRASRRCDRVLEAPPAPPRLGDDLRFFLFAWAVGFVAFLAFIA